MAEKIKYHLAEDTIDSNDRKALSTWLLSDPEPRLTMGPLTKQFEEKWSNWVGKKYSVFCNSGSSANLLMFYASLRSERLRNMKVVVPSVGWATTISPTIQFGFEPLMCEADADTFGLDLNHLEFLLKMHGPSIVMLVQVLGVPHKMNDLLTLQNKYGFYLFEDACAAMGSSYENRNVGSFGEMASFSFYFGHQISTIEGGAISTDDEDFYNILLMLRSHGWSKDLCPTIRKNLTDFYQIDDFSEPFVFYEPGFNLRSTDLNAFLGIRQMDKMDWLIKRRSTNHSHYHKLLGNRFYVQKYDPNKCVVCSIHFGMLADSYEQRKRIVTALIKNGIETRMFSAGNLGLHPFWYERYGKSSFPMADRIHDCGFFLPNNPSLCLDDINFICNVVVESAERKE